MVNRDHPAFKKEADPFYDIVMRGLKGEVDGEHFWDAVAEDAVFEFLYVFPGFPSVINGRKAYMDWFGGYSMKLQSSDNLIIHKTTATGVIILEYQVHGVTALNRPYDNRFCSVITVKDRKITHWRDYMDSFAVVRAMNGN